MGAMVSNHDPGAVRADQGGDRDPVQERSHGIAWHGRVVLPAWEIVAGWRHQACRRTQVGIISPGIDIVGSVTPETIQWFCQAQTFVERIGPVRQRTEAVHEAGTGET